MSEWVLYNQFRQMYILQNSEKPFLFSKTFVKQHTCLDKKEAPHIRARRFFDSSFFSAKNRNRLSENIIIRNWIVFTIYSRKSF